MSRGITTWFNKVMTEVNIMVNLEALGVSLFLETVKDPTIFGVYRNTLVIRVGDSAIYIDTKFVDVDTLDGVDTLIAIILYASNLCKGVKINHHVLDRNSYDLLLKAVSEKTSIMLDGSNTGKGNTAGGMKYDGDKPRMDLVFDGMPNAMLRLGEVLTFGAKKYAAHSWQTVPNASERYKAALLRHLLQYSSGEKIDSESGMSHLVHAAVNAMFILELEEREKKGNGSSTTEVGTPSKP